VEHVVRTKVGLHKSMKMGIAWYASWLSWARSMADKVGKQDVAGCWATVDDIYGDATGAAQGGGQAGSASRASGASMAGFHTKGD
jgi:hypothetical protein